MAAALICQATVSKPDNLFFWSFSDFFFFFLNNYNGVGCWGGGFCGGSVAKNPPANAGDTGLTPDRERSHMPRGNQACVPQLGSLCSRARGAATAEDHAP